MTHLSDKEAMDKAVKFAVEGWAKGNAKMSDKEVLQAAIQKAIDSGWKVEWIAKDAFRVWCTKPYWDEDGSVGEEICSREYGLSKPEEFILDHEFCRALWGDDEVDNNGVSLKTIQYWATQVAVKHLGKLHVVEGDRPVVELRDMPDIDFSKPPEELVEGQLTQYRLEKMAGSIPFETHRIKEVNVYTDSLPAYLHHGTQMFLAEDRVDYLRKNL